VRLLGRIVAKPEAIQFSSYFRLEGDTSKTLEALRRITILQAARSMLLANRLDHGQMGPMGSGGRT
jgi:hypothetical protein